MSDVLARTVLRWGMVIAGLCFAAWWAQHTLLDPARTQRVTHAVLDDGTFRSFLARTIEPTVSRSVPAVHQQAATPSSADALRTSVAEALARPENRDRLETFVADAHRRLIGEGSAKVTLDPSTVREVMGSALPGLGEAELASTPPVTFDVPQSSTLRRADDLIDRWLNWGILAAALLVVAGIALAKRRTAALRIVGRWLIGISLGHLLVTWLVPVHVIPRLSTSPWAHLIAAAAEAWSGGLVTTLVVLCLAGVALMFVEHFVPHPQVGDDATPPLDRML